MKPASFVLPYVLVVLLCNFYEPQVQAADDPSRVHEAKRLMSEGAVHLDQQNFTAALENFSAAMKLVPNPKIEFGIGLALEGLNQNALAYEAFTRYLAGPEDEKIERWREATKRQAKLRDRVLFVDVKADGSPALLELDGLKYGPLPLARPAVVEPGAHKVTVYVNGTSWTQHIEAPAGERVVVHAPFTPLPVVTATESISSQGVLKTTEATPAPSKHSHAAWLWSGAAVLLAGAVATAVVLSNRPGTERACASGLDCIRAQ